ATLRQLGEKPVRWVINTHYHDDHIAGNAALRAIGAVLVGHANLAREARKALTVKEWDWHRKPADEASLPQVEIHGRTDFVLGGHRIEITVAPRAHTDTDLMIWFPDANTVHMGDILEVGGPLFIDQWAGGSLEGVLAAIDSVLARADAETRIIPGHGKVVRKPELEAYRHMLVDVSTKVDAAIAAGLSAQEIVDAGLAAPYEEAVGGPVAGKRLVYTIYLDRTLEPKS
ncbi:MAG: MBL fold metallo-hydrolase, partial [Acidobacteria bacterium]|nr:MBL fold metallo-hydrolase [Acidobacteriota bacterium]